MVSPIFVDVPSILTYTSDPGKEELVKHSQATATVGEVCLSHQGLCQSINALRAHLETYNAEVWSILHEQDTCAVLAVEESTDEEAEMAQEKACYKATRSQVVHPKVVVDEGEEEDEGEGEGKGDKDEYDNENKPMCSSGLLVKAKEKRLVQ